MIDEEEAKQQNVLSIAHNDFTTKLNSYAFFKLNNHETGEDLVQDTFIKTWSYLVKGGKIDSMKSFLYHILNNLIVDEYRKRKHKTTSLDVLIENGFESGKDNSQSFFNIFDGKIAFRLVKKLPVAYQKVINMRYLQDLSLKEISILTGQTQNAIAVQIHRGIQKLKVLYRFP